jgi:lipopolysaccharide export system protein LptA
MKGGSGDKSILMVLLCTLCGAILYAGTLAQPVRKKGKPKEKTEQKRVYLIHADKLFYDRWRNNNAQVLIGNVQFEHDGAKLYCDSANFFEETNSFEAFGHVRMNQGDTLTLVSEYGFYDGNDQLMQALQNVVLKHRGTTLYTDSLYYDRLWNMGYFQEGGKMVDKGTTLVSDWGEYHSDTKMAIFYYDVTMTDKDFVLTSDSLYYDTNIKLAHIVGPSDINSGKSHIYSELGFYNTNTKEGILLNRSVMDNEGHILIGDSIWYNGVTGISEAFWDVVYKDTVNKNILTGEYGYYEDLTGYAMSTDSAMAIDYSQGDSLFMHADTFKVFTYNKETDSVYRVMHAYHKVRAYRVDLQAVCDSLVYNQQDSCMTLYRDPIVWNMNQQLLGEEIKVYMKDSVVDYAHVINQAFSIEDLHEKDLYNQVSSKEMFAFFVDGNIRETRSVDNVLVAYYPVDESDSSYIGMVSMETSEMRMFLEHQKLQRIWTPKSEGVVYPLTQVPPAKRFLAGFHWFDYVRPLSKEDIFNWRGKKPGTELKPQKRREAPVQRIPQSPTPKQLPENPQEPKETEEVKEETDGSEVKEEEVNKEGETLSE